MIPIGLRVDTPWSRTQHRGQRPRTSRCVIYVFDIIYFEGHILMVWVVRLCPAFVDDLLALPKTVQTELLAQASIIERFGPHAGRPRIDTLKGSRHSNMKELRFDAAGGVWRVAFAFDLRREAVLLAVANKAGVPKERFYRRLIERADQRFSTHQARLRTAPARH